MVLIGFMMILIGCIIVFICVVKVLIGFIMALICFTIVFLFVLSWF